MAISVAFEPKTRCFRRRRNSSALNFLPESLRRDRDVLLSAVQGSSQILKNVDEASTESRRGERARNH